MSQQVFKLAQAASQLAPDTAPGRFAPQAAEHAASGGESGGIQLGVHWTHSTPWGTIHVDTVLYTLIVMALCLIIFGLLGRAVSMRPKSVQVKRTGAIEWMVEFVQKILDDFVGHGSGKYLWYIGSLFVFILVANWLALLPWRAWELTGVGEALAHGVGTPHALIYEAPTADLNTTAGLALLSLLMYWVAGISTNGIGGFLGHHWFAKPFALFPLRMLEDLTRPLSLALRLFANIVAGHVVGVVLLGMVYFGAAALLPLELFVGAVQAFIFATLSASYIGGAVQEHH